MNIKKNNSIYNSHLGVYGLITENNKILLVKKNRGPYKNLMDLPGGSLENHESIEEALIREIKEETGSNILEYKQLYTFSSFFNYDENNKSYILRHIAIIYKIVINDNNVKYDSDGEDSDGCVWLNMNDIEKEIITPIVYESMKLIKC